MKKHLEQPDISLATDDNDVGSQPENKTDLNGAQNDFNLDFQASNSLCKEVDNAQIGNIPSKDSILSNDENLEKEKISLSDQNECATENSGSENLGKFRDAQSLLAAYNALQSEFTRKSQKLSSLQAQAQNFEKVPPEYMLDKKMDEFERKFEHAKEFRKQLQDRLYQSGNVDDADNILKDEYITILQKNVVDEKSLAQDERFLNDYIFCNKGICDSIVARYVLELKKKKPIKFNGSAAGSIPLTPHNRPVSVREAGELAKNIIKKN